MSETALALMDTGEANRRILSKDEYRADFRRVEIRTKLEEAMKELNQAIGGADLLFKP